MLHELLDLMIGVKGQDASGKMTVFQTFIVAVVLMALLGILGAIVMVIGSFTDPRNWF